MLCIVPNGLSKECRVPRHAASHIFGNASASSRAQTLTQTLGGGQKSFLASDYSTGASTHSNMSRTHPNIIITGTPGVGKTTHCELLATNTGLKHLSINQTVKDRGCHDGWDAEYKSWIVDEDKVCQSNSIQLNSAIAFADRRTPFSSSTPSKPKSPQAATY